MNTIIRNTLLVLTMGLAGLILSGCASITRGSKENLVVETIPANAHVRLNNGMSGTSPTSFKLPRKGTYQVYISKDGYEDITVMVNHQTAGAGGAAMAGNLLFGGIVGGAVDVCTGATQELTPNPICVTLVPCGEKVAKLTEPAGDAESI